MNHILTSVDNEITLLSQATLTGDDWSPRINNNVTTTLALCKKSDVSDNVDLNLHFTYKFPSYLKNFMIGTSNISIDIIFPGGNGIIFGAEVENSVIKIARDDKDTIIPILLHYAFEDIDPVPAILTLMYTKHNVYIKSIRADIPHDLLKKGIEVILNRRACANNQVRFDGKCSCMSKDCLICNK